MDLEETYSKLDELSRLNLSTYPVDNINDILNDLGQIESIYYKLKKGETIIRARPNKSDAEVFSKRDQLSYKPEHRNTKYQRASSPDSTMFYGCIIPEILGKEDFDIARLTAFTEASKTFRDNPYVAEEKLTFSRWEVKEDINLAMIAYHSRFLRQGSFVDHLNKRFRKILKTTMDFDLLYKSLVINEFFSDQFAKRIIREDYDYLLSALFTEHVIKQGFEGVFYPSVQSDGKGYNICLTPEVVNSKLKLTVVGEGRLYKYGKHSIVGNEMESLISDDTLPFTFTRVSGQNYTSRTAAISRIEKMRLKEVKNLKGRL